MSGDFEAMWREVAPLGRDARTGGYFRQPFTSPERELAAWFAEQAAARGLEVSVDGFGNQMAWWRPESATGQAVLTGSHLDSVLDGGAFDGPLGVLSAFAAVDVLRERGFVPSRPIAVGAFVEEEGSRFGLACLGSRLATGATTWPEASSLRDRDGVWLGDALAAAGSDPERGAVDLGGIGAFVELHVEQGRGLVDRGAAVGLASEIWPHGRWRYTFTGQANHAGSTRMEDRADPMLSYAMTALAANKQARLAGGRATFGRLSVEPNSTNAVPHTVTAWLDARADSDEALADLVDAVTRQGADRAVRDGTALEVVAESVSAAVRFDAYLTSRLGLIGERPGGPGWPILPSQAGHDAGVLAQAGVPTAMLFVRNPTGVSHSPAEHADTADCLSGVEALADVLTVLAGADVSHPDGRTGP